jgi:hypothetical protein
MSRKKPWFKFNDDAFLSATMGWPGKLKGFYALLIILNEAKHGKLLDDVTMISRATGYRPTSCNALLEALVLNEKCTRFDGKIDFLVQKSTKTPAQPVEKIEGNPKNRSSQNKISSLKKSLKKTSSKKKSERAPLGDKDAAPHASLSEDRAAFVRKILGREVRPGRVERPELHRLLEED